MLSLASNSSPCTFSLSPAQTFLTARVKRGPISCMSTPSQPSRKMQRWCRKKMKSRWLWKVTTRRPLNSGCWGKSEASSRPTRTPTLESKLLRMSSGTCSVATPWCLMAFWNSREVSRKTASMPCRCRTSSSHPLLKRTTITCVKLRVRAYLQTSGSLLSRRGQQATLWNTIISSRRIWQIFLGGFSWVVISILTGPSFQRMALNSSSMASSQSPSNSSPPSCLSYMVIGCCRSSAGSFCRSLRSRILICPRTALRLACTSTRFCLFLISWASFLKAVENSSMVLGLGLKALLLCLRWAAGSSLLSFALLFFPIVDPIIQPSHPLYYADPAAIPHPLPLWHSPGQTGAGGEPVQARSALPDQPLLRRQRDLLQQGRADRGGHAGAPQPRQTPPEGLHRGAGLPQQRVQGGRDQGLLDGSQPHPPERAGPTAGPLPPRQGQADAPSRQPVPPSPLHPHHRLVVVGLLPAGGLPALCDHSGRVGAGPPLLALQREHAGQHQLLLAHLQGDEPHLLPLPRQTGHRLRHTPQGHELLKGLLAVRHPHRRPPPQPTDTIADHSRGLPQHEAPLRVVQPFAVFKRTRQGHQQRETQRRACRLHSSGLVAASSLPAQVELPECPRQRRRTTVIRTQHLQRPVRGGAVSTGLHRRSQLRLGHWICQQHRV